MRLTQLGRTSPPLRWAVSSTELDYGLHRSDEDGVFDYELPTGDRIEMVRVEKGEFSIGPRLAPGYPGDDDPARIAAPGCRR